MTMQMNERDTLLERAQNYVRVGHNPNWETKTDEQLRLQLEVLDDAFKRAFGEDDDEEYDDDDF